MEKWGGMREKVGRGEGKGGMRGGKRADPEKEVEEGESEWESPNGKRVLLCEKGSVE